MARIHSHTFTYWLGLVCVCVVCVYNRFLKLYREALRKPRVVSIQSSRRDPSDLIWVTRQNQKAAGRPSAENSGVMHSQRDRTQRAVMQKQ